MNAQGFPTQHSHLCCPQAAPRIPLCKCHAFESTLLLPLKSSKMAMLAPIPYVFGLC